MVNCEPECKTIGARLPSKLDGRQVVDCQKFTKTQHCSVKIVQIFAVFAARCSLVTGWLYLVRRGGRPRGQTGLPWWSRQPAPMVAGVGGHGE